MTRADMAKVITAVVCTVLTTASVAETAKYMVDKSDYSIQQSLTGEAGDAKKGREIAINRKKGNCLACHAMPIPEQAFHGQIAPPLMGIGARYSPAQIRLRVVNPKVLNPNTIMPAFYKTDGYHRALDKFADKPILSAQEIEDVVAYLATLK